MDSPPENDVERELHNIKRIGNAAQSRNRLRIWNDETEHAVKEVNKNHIISGFNKGQMNKYIETRNEAKQIVRKANRE